MKNIEFKMDIMFELLKIQDEQIKMLNKMLKLQQTQIDLMDTRIKLNSESIKVLAGKEDEDEST